MNNPDQNPLRQRLRELLAIPDRNRTDAQWDELIELEILLAPGNREGAPDPNQRRNSGHLGGQSQPHGGQQHGKKPGKKSHQRQGKGNRR